LDIQDLLILSFLKNRLPNGKPFLNASPGVAYEAKRYALFFPLQKRLHQTAGGALF
jgi:hypothetical protein